MRKITFLKSLLLLCALIVGSSSAWADDELYYTLDGTVTGGNNGFAEESEITQEEIVWKATGNTTQNPWRIGGKSLTGVDRPIYSTTAMGADISKIVVDHGNASSITVNSMTVIVSKNEDFSDPISTLTPTFVADNEVTIERPDGKDWSDCYFKIVYNVSVSATSNKYIQFKSAKFYGQATAAAKVSTPSISGIEVFLTSTEVTISCGTDGAAIQYSTDNGTNWSSYSAPFTLNATTTVKAKATKDGMTDSDEANKTFTKVTPITVAAALTAINALADNGTIADQCVAGIISQIDNYGSNAITYWISDDGTTTSQLEVYKGKGLNGANFTALTDLNVGDEVTVYGKLQKYVKNETTTPEFVTGSQLLSYKATETPAPVITASNVTIDSEATSGEIAYTISNPTAAKLTAAVKTGDWISNLNVTAGKVTFTTTVNDGAQRVGYITLSYEGASSKDIKITQNATYGTASVPFAFDGVNNDIEKIAGLTQKSVGSYDSSPKLKFDGTGDYLILKINGAAEKLYFDIKGNSFSGGTFKVQTSADGVNYSDLKSYTELGAVSHESLDLESTVRYIKWIYETKSGGNVALGRIGVDCEAAYIPDAGYTTYTTPNVVDFTGTGVTAYKVSAIAADYITLEEVTKAPANTPLVLKADAGNYALNVIASADEVTGNELLVSDGTATTDASYTVYALASKGDPAVVGFYKVKADTKVPAGKAYLKVAATTTARDFLGFSNEATGISTLTNSQEQNANNQIFDLQGRRVAQPTKGLYIVNGKKVIVK